MKSLQARLAMSNYSLAEAQNLQQITVSCTECKNKNFKVADHQAVYKHFKGFKTMGIYPLYKPRHPPVLVLFSNLQNSL